MKKLFFAIVFMLSGSWCFGQINYENKIRISDDWLFVKTDLGSIWEAVRPASKGTPETVPLWTRVSLPHCFNAEDAVDPDVNYYQGPGWYKKMLEIDNPFEGGRIILHFEGAGQKTKVYIYTEEVAEHVGGYDEWRVDITDAVKRFLESEDAGRFQGKVPLVIRCDNTRDTEMIPSDLSDFNLYGGLYRYLNLVYVPAISFDALRLDAEVDPSGKSGTVKVTPNFTVHGNSGPVKLEIAFFDPQGKQVHHITKTVDPTQDFSYTWQVRRPRLWSPDSPQLYSCEIKLTGPAGEMQCKDKFGFRHFEFIKKGPFHLNGKRLLLRGTHRHEDHAGVAAAMTEEIIVAEMELMKKMGVNFIRLGHYQQSRIVLEQCDRLGILVWEEIPWCRGGLGGEKYKDQARRMLTNMITQHRNHPSVILWGLGNENDWPNDFPEYDREAIRAFMKELHDLSHELDNTRLTAIRRCAFCEDIIDVYSPSIWAGWYRGVYTDYKSISYNEMQKTDRFLHVEWGGDSHAGRHAENSYAGLDKIKSGEADERAGDASLYGGIARASKDGDWSETYICDLIDWHLKEQETMEWLTGAAYWPFKDFSTPVRPENPVPYMNQKGVVERDMTPKESYYVFQSYWTENPMVRIYGHSWPVRWGKEGEKKMVKVYSNCDQVELFWNGKSMGIKKRNSHDFPSAGLRWEIPFIAGENQLKAVGIKGKKKNQVSDEFTFTYETRPFGKETSIEAKITDIDNEYAWIEATFIDENGVPCLSSRKYFRFESSGDGNLIVNQGTSTGSKYVQAFNGKGKIKIRKNGGISYVAIKSAGMKTVFLKVGD